MKTNVGNLDRGLRILIGLLLLTLAFVGPETKWGFIGLIPLLTGLLGFCPAYLPLGISTCPLTGKSKN